MNFINTINFYYIFYFIVIILIANQLCKKYNLTDIGIGIQKDILYKSIPLSGGFIFVVSGFFMSLNFNFFLNYNYLVYALLLLFLILLGIFSDMQKIISGKKKLLIQIIILSFALYFSEDLRIEKTSLSFIDFLLNYKFFSIFFTSFCILIVINGSNFIDGTNGNCLIHSISLHLAIFLIVREYYVENFFLEILLYFIIVKIILLIFNLFGKCFLGDSGSYFLGAISGFNIIMVVQYFNLSPFLAVSSLFYLWFELLFSVLRKSINQKNPFEPDNSHLHLLLKRYLVNNNFKAYNNLTSIIINAIFVPFVFVSFFFKNNGIFLIFLTSIQIIIYVSLYYKLNEKTKY